MGASSLSKKLSLLSEYNVAIFTQLNQSWARQVSKKLSLLSEYNVAIYFTDSFNLSFQIKVYSNVYYCKNPLGLRVYYSEIFMYV